MSFSNFQIITFSNNIFWAPFPAFRSYSSVAATGSFLTGRGSFRGIRCNPGREKTVLKISNYKKRWD